MGPFIIAWMVGEGIVIYRSVKKDKAPPGPGVLLFSSGVFVVLALIAQSPKARPLATTLAWGFDIAAFMHLFDKVTAKPGGTWPPGLASPEEIIPGSNDPAHFGHALPGVPQTT